MRRGVVLFLLIPLSASLLPAAKVYERYALILTDPPVSEFSRTHRLMPQALVENHRQKIEAAQRLLRGALERENIPVTGSVQRVLNAVFVLATPEHAAQLRSMPGVAGVRPLRRFHLRLDHAVKLVNANPAAWNLVGGVASAGRGIKIGVIDTGIDQSHAAFQDDALPIPDGFPKCGVPSDCAFTNHKVIVARSYVKQLAAGAAPNPAATSRPDDYSARDRVGHGTAVAMAAAGRTNKGPSDTITGMAPEAYLGNYKVFGSPGVNDGATGDVIIQAVEDALNDGMDIAELSLGGPALSGPLDQGAACGETGTTPCDPEAQAMENAVQAGMLVVCAAGNEGSTGNNQPTLNTIDSPGDAPSVIAVGATTNSHRWISGSNGFFSVDVGGNAVAFFSSRGPSIIGALKPEVAAVGTELYLAAERFDPNGILYSPDGYTVSQGTSFSTPLVSGGAALVKQKNPGFTPAQLKSAIVNTATQDVTDGGGMASVMAVGGGKLDAAAAASTTVTVAPATVSFGVVKSGSFPVNQALEITNVGASAVTLNLTLTARTKDLKATLSLNKSTLSLDAGKSDSVTVTLGGTMPDPGAYEGLLTITGGARLVQVPYLYLVGDGSPANIIPVLSNGFDCTVNQDVPDGYVLIQLIDKYGVPVPNVVVQFTAQQGGSIKNADKNTDANGMAGAEAVCGPKAGRQDFLATAGGMTAIFDGTSRPLPTIRPDGALNAASNKVGQAVAPGSYISLYGTGLSEGGGPAQTTSLPLNLGNASVSFDVPSANLSLPGHLTYASSTQINVQVPWELSGQTSALIKVTIEDSQGALFTLHLAQYSPAFFLNGTTIAALDESFKPISSSNAAKRNKVVQLFANGLGPVDHPPASGEPAPSSPLAHTTVKPAVTIGGKAATVQFSGLAPGFPGLYQVNVVVPSNAPTGIQPVSLKINGVAAPAANLPIQ